MLATLYRKEVVEKMGLFDDNFTYFIDEYIPRLTTKLPYVVSTEPCFIAWIHGFSLSNAGRLKARAVFSDFNRFVDKVRQWVLPMDILEKTKQEIIVHVSQFSKPALYYICRHSIWNKDFGNATEAVNILRKELNAKRIFMLELILGTFKTFPWALNFAYPLLEIRKYIRSYKSRQTLHSMGYLENILKTINKLSH
ncbi:MAG: hypothetical protein NTY04_03000 [Candidatus Staskawiczbacteria bacterium]|nr:hypothetical protein [Candidatus Staskawiczbacteria bacterium]